MVEQGSAEEIEACVYNILSCPKGFRIAAPGIGKPAVQFGNVPLPLQQVALAVEASEPRASIDMVESILERIEQQRSVSVEVS